VDFTTKIAESDFWYTQAQGCGFAANKRVGTVLIFLELCGCTHRPILPALLS
jgi:hypothetical protein